MSVWLEVADEQGVGVLGIELLQLGLCTLVAQEETVTDPTVVIKSHVRVTSFVRSQSVTWVVVEVNEEFSPSVGPEVAVNVTLTVP